MEHAENVRNQFNLQAERFARWGETGDETHLDQYFRFCGLTPGDTVLDVACGCGNLAVHCAGRVATAIGVDISEGMIALARHLAAEKGVVNARFVTGPVESLPFQNQSFSAVLSKAAFHHFAEPARVLGEMLRCCQVGGRVCVQDIVAYPDPAVDAWVEALEKAIDPSHYRTWPSSLFAECFGSAALTDTRGVEFRVALDFEAYVGHHLQSPDMQVEVNRLVQEGLADSRLSGVFEEREGRLFLVRNVLLMRGTRLAQEGARERAGREAAGIRRRVPVLRLNYRGRDGAGAGPGA